MESVIDQLGRHRFLAFDRDHATGAPTVEVAHEALPPSGRRLRGWIEEARADIAHRAALGTALNEWSRSGRDPDYLLTGKRLAEYEHWRDYDGPPVDDSRAGVPGRVHRHRDAAVAARGPPRSRDGPGSPSAARWVALARSRRVGGSSEPRPSLAGRSDRPTVTMVIAGGGSAIDELMVEGLDRAALDFDFEPVVLQASVHGPRRSARCSRRIGC